MPAADVPLTLSPWPVVWDAPPGVGAAMTQRYAHAGSTEPYNLADHVGDDARRVQLNRVRLGYDLKVRPVFMNQVHGADCVELHPHAVDGVAADAATTRTPGLACTVMVADCLPVLLCNRLGTQVAAVHVGWRGLLRGVLDRAVASFNEAEGACMAWLGPCIGPQAFEVGGEVRSAFQATWLPEESWTDGFQPITHRPDKFWCDLAGMARWRLARLGVGSITGNDGSAEWCTVNNPTRWFSHRRDGVAPGVAGRMAACVWLSGAAGR